MEDNINSSQFLITLLILYSNIGKKDDFDNLLNRTKERIINEPEFLNYYGLKLLYEEILRMVGNIMSIEIQK